MTDYQRLAIEAEAIAEAANVAQRRTVLGQFTTRIDQIAQIDQRVADAGLTERHEQPGEVADRIHEAGLDDAVRHREPGTAA